MKRSPLLIAGALILAPAAANAQTAPNDVRSAFGVIAESDADLAASYGGATGAISRYRDTTTVESISYLQRVGQDASIAVDNWWAQTGAALVNNNLLSAR